MGLASSLSHFFGNGHRGDAAPKGKMHPLGEAAATVLATARKRGYAIAAIAGMDRTEEQAREWLAENMIGIVPVFEKNGSGWRRAEKGPIAGRELAVPQSSIDAYLKWASQTY